MKKRMRILKSILIAIVLSSFSGANTVEADDNYFENHADWEKYCMRASDIIISKSEYLHFIESGKLHQTLTNYSHITIKSGNPNIPFENWDPYYGKLFLDTSNLMKLDLSKESTTQAIVFYMKDKTTNYMNVALTVVKDKLKDDSQEIDDPSKPSVPEEVVPPIKNGEKDVEQVVISSPNGEENKGDIDHSSKIKEGKDKSFFEWLFSGKNISFTIPILGIIISLTPFSMSTFSITLLIILLIAILIFSDIRMLTKYRKDKETYLCSKYKR